MYNNIAQKGKKTGKNGLPNIQHGIIYVVYNKVRKRDDDDEDNNNNNNHNDNDGGGGSDYNGDNDDDDGNDITTFNDYEKCLQE